MDNRDGIVRRSVLTAALALAGAGCVGPSSGFRYRLTLHARAGGRLFAGSAVQQFVYRRGTRELGSRRAFSGGGTGEGVVVNLGDRGVLVSTFLTLQPPGSDRPEASPFGDRPPLTANWDVVGVLTKGLDARSPRPESGEVSVEALTAMTSSSAVELSMLELPLLLHFPNPRDPASVRRVDPRRSDGEIDVVSATVRVTRDARTEGELATALPWAPAYREASFNLNGMLSQSRNDRLASRIRVNDFWRRGRG